MPLKKEPFRPYRLEEEKKGDKLRTFTISMNKSDEMVLRELKQLFDIKSDGEALKVSTRVALNVLRRTFGEDLIKRLFKKERLRLSDFENIK